MTAQTDTTRDQLLDAALMHVAFDGWSPTTFDAAVEDCGIEPALARALFPRGAVDLALAYHARGDAAMMDRIKAGALDGMRIRDKITSAIRFRFDAVADREAVRRGSTLFAQPQYAADGAKAIWGTCDAIWNAIGDSSEDVNWYTKRASLAAVYSATVIYWLGDDSPDHQATWEFLDRRIENVMQFESFKAKVRKNPFLKPFLAGPEWLAGHIRAPSKSRVDDLPGRVGPR